MSEIVKYMIERKWADDAKWYVFQRLGRIKIDAKTFSKSLAKCKNTCYNVYGKCWRKETHESIDYYCLKQGDRLECENPETD